MLIKLLACFLIVCSVCFSQEQYTPILQQRTNENSFYGEILNRTDNVISGHERATNAHENIHMINNYHRNRTKLQAFYITGEKKVFLTQEPKLFKNDVKKFIPRSLIGTRHKTYLEDAQDWNGTPTYLMDEWVAYIGGAMVALEDYENKINRDYSDRMCGALEFSIYTVALCMAIEEKDQQFWKDGVDFRNFVDKMLVKSCSVFHRGRHIKDFASTSQERLLKNLHESDDARLMRIFINKWFNGTWLEGKND